MTSFQDPRRIPAELRRKYDVRGPRYTSYPPATHFGPVDLDALLERWRSRNGLVDDPGLSLYVHIPFCRSRCLFCGCHTLGPKDASRLQEYLDAVLTEMELAQRAVDRSRPVRQIALGGGTPTFPGAASLERLLDGIEDRWEIEPDAELSVEIDPRTATRDRLDVLLAPGFNRISLGIQDFSDAVLDKVRKGQKLMQVLDVLEHLRAGERDLSINFDLIYGLPGQDLDTARATATQTVDLAPDRIALYSYAHVPWIRPHQKALERLGLPDQDTKLAMFLEMSDIFTAAGYRAIGMDHFAKPGDPLARALDQGTLRRNFMGYTTGRGLDTIGFGVSAISSVGSTYSQDEKALEPYLERVGAGEPPVMRGRLLTRDDELRRELLLELFCNFKVDFGPLGEAFGVDPAGYFADDLQRLDPMVRDGLVTWDRSGIRVSDLGRYFIRNVCMTFDRYLETDPARRVYSRTV